MSGATATDRAAAAKRARQQLVRELLGRNEIADQEQLRALLEAEGVVVSQSTVSRDLFELGVWKGPEGQLQPAGNDDLPKLHPELAETLSREVQSIEHAGHLVVLTAGGSSGRGVARQLRRCGLPQVLGALADEETVLVTCRTSSAAGDLSRRLRRVAGLRR